MNRELAIALLVIAAGIYFLVGYQSGENTTKPEGEAPAAKSVVQVPAPPARNVARPTPPPAARPTPPPALQAAPAANTSQPSQTPPPVDTIWRVVVNEEDASLGSADAPITAVIFTAFGCETCRTFAPAVKRMKDKFGKKVRVVIKHKILPPTPYALEASIASLAAKEQGKFWEMHDKLFENSPAFDPGSLERYAKEIGLNIGKFKKDIKLDRLRGQIMRDTLLANEVGAHSMPNILVNGVRIRGEKSYENLVPLLEQELEKAKQGIKGGIAAKDYYSKTVASGKNFQQLEPTKFRFSSANSATLGKPDAQIVITVFEDFQ